MVVEKGTRESTGSLGQGHIKAPSLGQVRVGITSEILFQVHLPGFLLG